MSNGNGKPFTYHDLYKQVEDVETRLNEKIKCLEDKFELFKNNDLKGISDKVIAMATELAIFKKIGYWILAAMGANLIALILNYFKIPK